MRTDRSIAGVSDRHDRRPCDGTGARGYRDRAHERARGVRYRIAVVAAAISARVGQILAADAM